MEKTKEGMVTKNLQKVLEAYGVEKRVLSAESYGNGHINDTVLVLLSGKDGMESTPEKMIIQRINTSIFKDPVQLMQNIAQVTDWIREKVCLEGGNAGREVLQIVPTLTGQLCYQSETGEFYRAYIYVENGICLEKPRSAEDLFESGVAFGKFQGYLADFPAKSLVETIPDFHNTLKRLEAFKNAVKEDVCGLADAVKAEIEYALSMEEMVQQCAEYKKKLPLRVTHNDTKLNNAMLDAVTQKALCVLDLDTVMPGFAMDDFGDAIRFGASTALEDESDLSKVFCDLDMFQAFAKGFLRGTGGRLTEEEILLFPLGAKIMTYECGIRFLMDYLQGNIYFKVAFPEHNLVRARNQFALLKDMNRKTEEMNRIIKDCLE